MAVNHSLCEVSAALSAKGRLRRFGVLNNRFDFNERLFGGFMDGTETEAVERRFYQKSEMREVLPWEYYGEMARKDGETMKRIISAGGPCNILFYGAPGTGKTSFAHSLVKELGRTGFEIRQGDADGRNMRADARMAGIQMCNEQEDASTSVVVVDEADELLRSSVPKMSAFGQATGGKTMEKGVVNSILDEIRIPTIWISNTSAESIDESVRRRFDYSVKFNRLNRSQRMSIWRNLVSRNGLSHCIGEEKIRRYAEDFDTSAGGISNVLANAKRIGVDSGTVDEVVSSLMKPHCQLMGIEAGSHSNPAGDYSLEGLNINGGIPLERMFGTRLADAEAMRLAAIPNLAPGDFRTVRQSLYYLGGSASNETILNGLEKESALKKCSRNRIGF